MPSNINSRSPDGDRDDYSFKRKEVRFFSYTFTMYPNQNFCRYCKNIIDVNAYFCPNCGKKLRDKPLSTSLLKQIGVYVVSLFFPPFGLIPGIKYLKQEDSKSKMVGVLAISITLISLIISIIITINVFNSLNKVLNSQLNYGSYGF